MITFLSFVFGVDVVPTLIIIYVMISVALLIGCCMINSMEEDINDGNGKISIGKISSLFFFWPLYVLFYIPRVVIFLAKFIWDGIKELAKLF